MQLKPVCERLGAEYSVRTMESDKPVLILAQRLILALWPDDDVRRQLAAHAGQWAWPAGCVKYLPADWHVTLHFIGNVDAQRLVNLAQAVAVPLQRTGGASRN